MRKLLLAIAALWAGAAQAQVGQVAGWPPTQFVAGGGGGYSGPVDILASPVECYSLRACTAALAASQAVAINAKSSSHSTETCDIKLGTDGFIGGTGSVTANCSGADNGISLSAFCTSNSDCFANTIYGQINSRNQIAGANGCLVSVSPLALVCAGTESYSTSGTFSIPQPVTASIVAQRTSSTTTFNVAVSFDNTPTQSGFTNSSGNIIMFAGTLTGTTYTEGNQVSLQETYDGANSVVDVNGVSTTGLNPGSGSSTAAAIGLTGGIASGHTLHGNWWETIIWQGTAANHTNFPFASVTSNQRDATKGWNF